MVLSFFIQGLLHYKLGVSLLTILILFESIWQIKIHKKPISGKLTAISLQISLWLIVIGYASLLLVPTWFRIDVIHLVFVGGFALATIAVATRVILSHCGYSRLLKQSYAPFTITVVLMLSGLNFRISAFMQPDSYYTYIAYSGLIWLMGLVVWSLFILSLCIKDTLTYLNSKS